VYQYDGGASGKRVQSGSDRINSLRAARGEDEVDVEAELAALTRPASEPALEAEVRQHVESRNRRRIARGLEPLDVDAEVERRLRGR
jgi:hypothetical protein